MLKVRYPKHDWRASQFLSITSAGFPRLPPPWHSSPSRPYTSKDFPQIPRSLRNRGKNQRETSASGNGFHEESEKGESKASENGESPTIMWIQSNQEKYCDLMGLFESSSCRIWGKSSRFGTLQRRKPYLQLNSSHLLGPFFSYWQSTVRWESEVVRIVQI